MDENSIEVPPVVIEPQFSQLQELGVSFDAEDRLDEDVACRNCKYNLRGIMLDSCCPECNAPVEFTLHPSLLRFSDPQWLARVRSGSQFMIACLVGVILLSIFWMVAIPVFNLGYPERSLGLELCITTFIVALLSIQIIAYMRITTLESKSHLQDAMISSRQLARITLITSVIMGSIALMTNSNRIAIFFSGINEIQVLTLVSKWTGISGTYIEFIGMFALLVYARSLALRFPNDRLAKHTRLVMWGYLIPAIANQLLPYVQITDYVSVQNSDFSLGLLLLTIQIVPGILMLAFCIWGVVLLFQYRSQLGKAKTLATK